MESSLHQITYDKNKIKVLFNKKIQDWTWDKNDIKYLVSSYKDYHTILLIPATLNNFQKLLNKYGKNKDYNFTKIFFQALDYEIDTEEKNETKRNLLKEKVTLDKIDERPFLLEHKEPLPFKHQRVGLEYAIRFPGFYTLDEMRLGKTRVAIERHIFLKENLKRIKKSIIICPLTIMYVWANEIKKWSDCNYVIISGNKKQKLELFTMFKERIDFWIINYEGVNAIHNELLGFIDNETNIILDEFIKIKNHTRIRSKNTIALCENTEYVHALCGTPETKIGSDIFSPSLAVDKGKKFGFSHDKFTEEYFWKYGYNLKPKHGRLKEISDKLYQNALRFTRKECSDMPEEMYSTIPIDLPSENMKAYEQMMEYCIAMINEKEEITAPIILVQLLRLSQITSGFSVTETKKIIEFKEQPKLNALSELLDQSNSDQIVIWSRFVRDVKAIAKLCKSKGLTYGCLVGKDTTKIKEESMEIEIEIPMLVNDNGKVDTIITPTIVGNSQDYSDIEIPTSTFARQKIIDDFDFGNRQIIIGTAATGGMGINLSKANTAIYYANDYSLLNRLQSKDRIIDINQKNQNMYYDIVANGTIDVGILGILKDKKKVADVITRDNLLSFVKGEE